MNDETEPLSQEPCEQVELCRKRLIGCLVDPKEVSKVDKYLAECTQEKYYKCKEKHLYGGY